MFVQDTFSPNIRLLFRWRKIFRIYFVRF